MAFFLPSYFQKRLLRYALGRLDFIDSDALDLDNLDLAIGQRSVIELKSIAIRVDKLVERLALPPSVLPQNAVVHRLRIVVPADLHASGIEVEIDGIDVVVHLKQPAASVPRSSKRTRPTSDGEPSHKDIANRPRIASPSLHDPGGARHDAATAEHEVHLLPRPRDLAESFLEAAPEHERSELENVVQSQSMRLQQSRAPRDQTLVDDITGLGEGFSLPGFVTSFLVGIADRLSISLKRIAVSATLPSEGSEGLQLLLKIEEFELQAVHKSSSSADPRRKVRIVGIELLVVTDQDTLSAKSRPSSPKLTRSRFVPSPTSQRALSPEITKSTSESQSSDHVRPILASSSSSSLNSQSEDGIGPGDSMLGSQIFSSTVHHSPAPSSPGSPQRYRGPDSPSKSDLVTSAETSRSPSPLPDAASSHDMLAESMLYSHTEAQSMYMSALSNARMPGGFEATEDSIPSLQPSLPGPETQASQVMYSAGEEQKSGLDNVTSSAASLPVPSKDVLHTTLVISPQDCVKRLLRINEVVLNLPPQSATSDPEPLPDLAPSSPVQTPIRSVRSSFAQPDRSSSSHRHKISDQSMYIGIPKEYRQAPFDKSKTLEVRIRDVEVHIDVALCSLLVKAGSRALQIVTPQEKTQSDTKIEDFTDKKELHVQGGIRSLVIHLMDNVPDVFHNIEHSNPTESTFSMYATDRSASLLQLQILDVEYNYHKVKEHSDQKFSIRRLGLYQNSEKYLSFFDAAQLQDSFVSSSMMAEPHDIVVHQVGERVEVSTKPIHVMLDLLVIDEVLSRSGGLSSLLDLGSSIVSTDTVKGKTDSSPGRRRSVHFAGPQAEPVVEDSPIDSLKINVRISGLVVDLVGSESSVQIKTSAVKIIKRSSGLKLSVVSTSIYGPLVQDTLSMTPLTLKIRGITLEFRDKPYETDLDRLLSLLVPSSDKYEADDDIMVDTLLRQRRKGSLVQVKIEDIQFRATTLFWLPRLTKIVDEISKLSSVAKYLPEDDKPGLLSFILVNNIDLGFQLSNKHDAINLNLNILEAAHITVPALMAVQISGVALKHGHRDSLLHALLPEIQDQSLTSPPMVMCRFIPNEMEPTIKLKLANAAFEYSVPMFLSMTKMAEDMQSDLGSHQTDSPLASELSAASTDVSDSSRRVKFSIAVRNSAVLLKPLNLPSAGLFFLADAALNQSARSNGMTASLALNKASIMVVDDVSKIGGTNPGVDAKLYFDQNDTVQELVKLGYVPVGTTSGAVADIIINKHKVTGEQYIDVEFKNNLIYLETCADSTQTLGQVFGSLSPPSAPSKQDRFRTQIVPLEDMLASFTGNAFVSEPGPQLGMSFQETENTPTSSTVLSRPTSGHSDVVGLKASNEDQDVDDEISDEDIAGSSDLSRSLNSDIGGASVHVAPVNPFADDGIAPDGSVMMHSLIDFRDNHFVHDSSIGGTAHRWDSTENTYGMSSERTAQTSPLKVRVRDVHIIWNLFDGYDWENTRDVISQAVRDVEDKALARQQRRMTRRAAMLEDDDESVIGDVLFNSIYISIPTKSDARDLTSAINMDLGDIASETGSQTGSYATSTTVTAATSKRHSFQRPKPKKLRLKRSKQHKMTFELEGLAVDFLAFPPKTGEIESSIDIRVHKLDIFDHVPTSTWRKFATYMHESGEREVGTDQIHIELLNVKPVEELAASEIIMKLTVLPLRLHVDQDALDFLTRFFEFKDDRVPPSSAPSNPPFIQRVEVNPIKVRLDFKPKRVDYGGLRSGRTTEFMNFFILERADLVLRRVILYGVSGFDRMGIMLNGIWTPDVRDNQLPTVLAGLTPMRSLVDVGSGVRDLVAIPIREYRKDGRLVRSIQKGAAAFAKTTTTELVNLGAKLAIGTQTVLQTAEDVLAPQHKKNIRQASDASDSSDDEQPHVISHYADQPLGIVQGLRGAYASLERDLLLAKDAIVAVPGEIMADGSATGAAKVVLKSSPTIILRPAIGLTKAVGTALLGAGNTLDKGNRRRVEDKYKSR